MNPYPFVGLNHFTVPVATITLHCSHYGLTIIRQSADTGYGSKYKKPENPMVIAAATEAPRGAHHARPERRRGRIIGAVAHVGVFDGFSIVSTWPQAGHWYVINSGIAPTRG